MTGIPSDLHRRLRRELAKSPAFDGNRALRALFVDEKLKPWRNQVPEATNVAQRVGATIAFLVDRHNVRGENALVLLLQALRDQTDRGDLAHSRLVSLIGDLQAALELDKEISSSTEERTNLFDQRGQRVEQQFNIAGDYVDRRSSQDIHIQGDGNVIGDHSSSHIEKVRPASQTEPEHRPSRVAVLRQRLHRLDSVEIESLCLDHFPSVYDKFNRGLRRDEMINLLLDHCRRNSQDAERLKALLQ